MSFNGRGRDGTGVDVELDAGVSEGVVGGSLRSGRDEKIAAVAAAPVAAEMPAMMARVVLDMFDNLTVDIWWEKERSL